MSWPPITRWDGVLFQRQLKEALDALDAGGGGASVWGGITGTLTDQADLDAALDAKQDTLVSATNIKTVNGSSLLGSGNLAVSAADSFETVNKNLSASDATLGYSGGDLVTVTYANGIIKTLGYSGGNLTTVTLSGSTPGGIDLVKTLSYTGADLTGVAYS